MYCQHCGKQIPDDTKFCTECGAAVGISSQESSVQTNIPLTSVKSSPKSAKKPFYKKPLFWVLVIIGFWMFRIISVAGTRSGTQKAIDDSLARTEYAQTVADELLREDSNSDLEVSHSAPSATPKPSSNPKLTQPPLFDLASTTTNMKVGEINKDGSWYVGLSAVRATNVLYTAINWHSVEIPAGQEVVYVLLEVYNNSGKIKSYSSSNLSVYVDSSKAADPDTYMLVGVDGYQAYNSFEIDPGTKLLLVDAYLVPIGWKELTVFANDLSWSLTQQDILRSSYTYSTLFSVNTPSDFLKYSSGDVIYSKEYTVKYDGCLTYTQNNVLSGSEDYAVFEFTINNTSSETLDYNFVGYNMRGYQDLRLLDEANNLMNDNINGYSNVFDVDEIKPGMSAKVYVAFELNKPGGLYTCAFDTGYIVNNLLAYVSYSG